MQITLRVSDKLYKAFLRRQAYAWDGGVEVGSWSAYVFAVRHMIVIATKLQLLLEYEEV